MLRNQKGFTLIEIIAVLVILGILAAVAIPKFINMQTSAEKNALQGAIAALKSTVTMGYANALLTTPATTTYTVPTPSTVVVGDFTGSIAAAAGVVTVTVTAGPSWFVASNFTGSNIAGTVTLY